MTNEIVTIAQCRCNAEPGKNGKMKPALYLLSDGREVRVWTTGKAAVPLPPPYATINAQIEASEFNNQQQYTLVSWSMAGGAPAPMAQPVQPVAHVAPQPGAVAHNPGDPFEDGVRVDAVSQRDRLIIAQVALKAGVEITTNMEVADPASHAIELAEKFFNWLIVRGNQ